MTNDEKAKAYEMALEAARKELGVDRKEWEVVQQVLHNIFPELTESEDERTRKDIINLIYWLKANPSLCSQYYKDRYDSILAYLEKQKEQKPQGVYVDCTEHPDWYGMPTNEQKPVEIKIDNPNVQKFDPDVKVTTSDSSADGKELLYVSNKSYKIGFRDGVASVKQEWSEEDEEMLNSCISSIEEAKENRYAYKETDGDTSYDHEMAWLKSLRPQPHWKPSEEQMKALKECGGCKKAIESLYNDLKKLKED